MRTSRIALLLSLTLFLSTAAAPGVGAADSTGIVTGVVKHRSVKKSSTVVYVEGIQGAELTPSAVNPVMDQRGKVFVPAILPVVAGTTVDFLNSDSFDHNVFSPDGEEYDLGKWPEGEKRSYTFKQPGVYAQLCRVHPEMVAYIVVLDTPHFAIADQEGNFSLPDLPPGTWTLKVWNERLRPKQLKKSFTFSIREGQATEMELSF